MIFITIGKENKNSIFEVLKSSIEYGEKVSLKSSI